MTPAPEILALEAEATRLDVPMKAAVERAGMDWSTWWRWINAKSDPRLSKLNQVRDAIYAIAEEAGVAVDDGGARGHAQNLSPQAGDVSPNPRAEIGGGA